MEIYMPMTQNELSQRRLEEYEKLAKIINWGRNNPVKFCETVAKSLLANISCITKALNSSDTSLLSTGRPEPELVKTFSK